MHEYNPAGIEVTTTEWTYDAADRLTHEERTLGLVPLDIAYQYDQNGNRTREIRGTEVIRYSYNENDQLTEIEYPDYISEEYAYDARGNLASVHQQEGISSPVEIAAYSYDARNQLTSVTSGMDTLGTFSYDYAGRRTQMNDGTLTTDYLWDEFSAYGDVVLETNVAGTTAYTLANGTLISQTVDTGTPVTSYFLTDAIGSTRMLTDGAGTPTGSYEYDAFGNLLGDPDVQTLGTDYLYAGQQFDPMTELYSMRARYYDSATGRFMSRDTWAYNYQNPVELNRYVYAANNPVMFTDPSGHSIMQQLGSIVTAASQSKRAVGFALGFVSGAAVSGIIAPIFWGMARTKMCGDEMYLRFQKISLAEFQATSIAIGSIVGGVLGAFPEVAPIATGLGIFTSGLAVATNPNFCTYLAFAAALIGGFSNGSKLNFGGAVSLEITSNTPATSLALAQSSVQISINGALISAEAAVVGIADWIFMATSDNQNQRNTPTWRTGQRPPSKPGIYRYKHQGGNDTNPVPEKEGLDYVGQATNLLSRLMAMDKRQGEIPLNQAGRPDWNQVEFLELTFMGDENMNYWLTIAERIELFQQSNGGNILNTANDVWPGNTLNLDLLRTATFPKNWPHDLLPLPTDPAFFTQLASRPSE